MILFRILYFVQNKMKKIYENIHFLDKRNDQGNFIPYLGRKRHFRFLFDGGEERKGERERREREREARKEREGVGASMLWHSTSLAV